MFFCPFLDEELSRKWNKLRRRCASFKSVQSGPSSLDDTETDAMLIEHPSRYQIIPQRDLRIEAYEKNVWRKSSILPLSESPRHSMRALPIQTNSPFHHNHHNHHHHSHHTSIPTTIVVPVPVSNTSTQQPQSTTTIYQPVTIHEDDLKYWPVARTTVADPIRRNSAIDWEFNAQQFEQSMQVKEKLQYYDKDLSCNKNGSIGSEKGVKIARELKIPGLKSFKSASMRLPGQKTSISEVSLEFH